MWTGVSWMRLVSNGRKVIKGQTIVRRIEQKRKVFFRSRANSYLIRRRRKKDKRQRVN